jgi:hypothetical protein
MLIVSSAAVAAAPSRSSTSQSGVLTPAMAQLGVTDGPGGVVAKAGSERDTDASLDGFKPGAGALVPATAADRAMDLLSTRYRVVRAGRVPALKVSYRVAGSFAHSETSTSNSTAYIEQVSFDAVATYFNNGYQVQTLNLRHRLGSGLISPKGKLIACAGFRTSMPLGASVATQLLPLSCLEKVGITTSRLQSESGHGIITITTPTTGPDGKATSTSELAVDVASKTKRVRLAALAR